MLKDRTLFFKRARKAFNLKFRHIEYAIGGDIHSKIWRGGT